MFFAFGLLSLGRYQHFFNFFDEIRDYIESNSIYTEFIHIFLLLVSNSAVLSLQMKEKEAESTLVNFYGEIFHYLSALK